VFFLFFSLTTCRAENVLDKPIPEALVLLEKGDFSFISSAEPSRMKELTALGKEAPFYIGLKLLKLGDRERAISALLAVDESSSVYIQQTRLKTLIPLLLEDKKDDRALAILEKVGKNAQTKSQSWYRSLMTEVLFTMGQYRAVLDLQKNVEKTGLSVQEQGLGLFSQLALDPKNQTALQNATAFFLTGPLSEASRRLFTQIQQAPDIFLPETVVEAVRGRLFIFDRSYGDALYYFKDALRRNRYLFEAYPDLLADLGKAYQYSGVAKEGIKVFTDWESTILSGQNTRALVTTNDKNEIRFKLLFYAGRMARQLSLASEALNYFYKALPLAPDPQQRDACIWYILDSTLEGDTKNFPGTLENLIPIWSIPSYFDDLLDKICTTYTTDHNWDGLLRIFTILYQKADSPIQARYAYILARAITEGYILVKDQFDFLGLNGGADRAAISARFYKIAFETDKASLYYRSLSSAFLGKQLQLIPEDQESQEQVQNRPQFDEPSLMAYLSDFFTWGTADIALPYILEYKDQLKAEEIYQLIERFAQRERWGDQIQLVSKTLFSRPNYIPKKSDYTLLYPLPFRNLMEPIAKQHKIPLELFYGLVRTESAFIPDVRSNAGAKGLTQLMLPTAKDAAWRIKRAGGPDFSITDGKDLENPETNLYIGAWYLSYLIEKTGSPLLALASYNGGMTRVRNWRASQAKLAEDLFLETIPIAETREYSKKVLAAASVYGYLYFNMSMEAVFADIFPVQ
jgi:soluble lytic murein transglycosylase